MKDKIELIGNSEIQHGKASNRIYLMKLGKDAGVELIDQLQRLAVDRGYGKIIAKVPETQENLLRKKGFIKEAAIPGYFMDDNTCLFMGHYLNPERARITDCNQLEAVLEKAESTKDQYMLTNIQKDMDIRELNCDDAEEMADVFDKVFVSYPFPVFDPNYIRKTMDGHIIYFGIAVEGKLAAIASCETDQENKSCEMTDFAVLPKYRGNAFAQVLLIKMEKEMKSMGYTTFYTIARAASFGMNATFSKMGYRYGGRLTNNTQIGGQIESMNVWHKKVI